MDKLNYVGKTLLVETCGKKILVIGDLHLGYEEYLNNTGIMIVRHLFEEGIDYLEKVFREVGKVNEIVLLGDIKHYFGRVASQERRDFANLIKFLKKKCKTIIITKGNHDRVISFIKDSAEVDLMNFYVVGKFCFLHGDKNYEDISKDIEYFVMGHWHPAVIIGDGIKTEKYKCFLEGRGRRKIIVVPSFFEGSLGSDPRETALKKVWKVNVENMKTRVVIENNFEVFKFEKFSDLFS